MIGVPVNSNSVYVPMVQTGCLKAEFDSTYPIHLNGIISQHEFQESIHKINFSFSNMKNFLIISWIIFTLAILVGTVLCILGGAFAVKSLTTFYILLSVGLVLTTFGSLFVGIGACVINAKRVARMRQAITEESMKYSSRSPTPCSWRLDTSRTLFGGYGYYNNNQQILYQLVIDIGCSTSQDNVNQTHYSNKIAPEPTSSFGRNDNYAPPAYSINMIGFCSRCGVARRDLTAQYCSSCGQLFN